jgi:serine/threonine protein kinase/tetratricopeptide (TPR) repeat protein
MQPLDQAPASSGERNVREKVEETASTLLAEAAAARPMEGPNHPGASRDPIPDRIGRYRVLKKLGEGGFGVVYQATPDDGLRRIVALKVLRPGVVDVNAVRRFHRERHILPSLHHPNIAGFLDADESADGRPFYVMEYVEGTPITTYCDRNGLTVRERIALFERVCDAVQHAHERFILHRDLKPSNILVDRDGTPKLLDFGIARFLARDAEASADLVTVGDESVLTPEYASPEQLRGDPLTTGSDVYSLGVVLYELLAGRRPYELTSRLRLAASKLVDDTRVLAPSEKLTAVEAISTDAPSTDSVEPVEVATRRGTSIERLRRQLVGDIDNIVLTSLRKEPVRRYPAVRDLLDDLRRHQRGEPVRARGDVWTYRVGKFVRRHRWSLSAGSLITALAVWSMIASVRLAYAEARVAIARESERANTAESARAQDEKLAKARQEVRAEVAGRLGALTGRLVGELRSNRSEGASAMLEFSRDHAVLVADIMYRIAGVSGDSEDQKLQRAEAANALLSLLSDASAISTSAVTSVKTEALATADEAAELWSELRATDPKSDETLAAYADALRLRGTLQRRLGRSEEGLADARAAVNALLAGNEPARSEMSNVRSKALIRARLSLADHLSNKEGTGPERLALVQASRKLAAERGYDTSEDPQELELSAVVHTRIGDLAERAGEKNEAVEHYRLAFELRLKARRIEPTSPIRRVALLNSAQWIHRSLRIAGRLHESRQYLDVFQQISAASVTTNVDAVSQLSIESRGHELRGHLAQAEGRPAEAEVAYAEAISALELAQSRFSSTPDSEFLRRIGQLRLARGVALADGNRLEEANADFAAAASTLGLYDGKKKVEAKAVIATAAAGSLRMAILRGDAAQTVEREMQLEQAISAFDPLRGNQAAYDAMVDEAVNHVRWLAAAKRREVAVLRAAIRGDGGLVALSDEGVEHLAQAVLLLQTSGGETREFCDLAAAIAADLDRRVHSLDQGSTNPRVASVREALNDARRDACGP